MKHLYCLMLFATVLSAQDAGVIKSKFSKQDFALTADPGAPQWKPVKPVIISNDRFGKPVAGHRTEVRARWTKDNLYFLFVCPYEALYMKPSPSTTTETNNLWNWDVAEVFIGSDFNDIHLYKEFEMSPQGEWVDLDIHHKEPRIRADIHWDSGFTVKARIDEAKKIWYGELKIPVSSVDNRPAKAGNRMRINLYRIQGPEPRVYLAWRPVNNPSYHTPSAFGEMHLEK